MRKLAALLLVVPTAAMAALPEDVDDPPEKKVIVAQPVPCLRDDRDKRYTVRWVIQNLKTGEIRDVGSQDVRQRC